MILASGQRVLADLLLGGEIEEADLAPSQWGRPLPVGHVTRIGRASMRLARPSSLRTVARREREVVEHSSPAIPEQEANADDLVDT